jgi:hypothetical protein
MFGYADFLPFRDFAELPARTYFLGIKCFSTALRVRGNVEESEV